jgi:hypothetical protein
VFKKAADLQQLAISRRGSQEIVVRLKKRHSRLFEHSALF